LTRQPPPSPKKRRSTPPDPAVLQMISDIVKRETASPTLDIETENPDTDDVPDDLRTCHPSTAPTTSTDTIWIFGYGSLIWKCDYPILRFVWGSVTGYKRRLWQGSPDHRGTPSRPGRVFTMLPADTVDRLEKEASVIQHDNDHGNVVWGRCFELERASAVEVMKEIDVREIAGFAKEFIQVKCVDGVQRNAIVYAALPNNEHFLGPASLEDIASHVSGSQGPSGSNTDYVVNTMQALEQATLALTTAVVGGSGRALPNVDGHLKSVCNSLLNMKKPTPVLSRRGVEGCYSRVGCEVWCRGRLIQIVPPPDFKQNKKPAGEQNKEEEEKEEEEEGKEKEKETAREKHTGTALVTSAWPIVYYTLVGDTTNVVYHCHFHDDGNRLPFTTKAFL